MLQNLITYRHINRYLNTIYSNVYIDIKDEEIYINKKKTSMIKKWLEQEIKGHDRPRAREQEKEARYRSM